MWPDVTGTCDLFVLITMHLVMWYVRFLETITRQTSSNIRLRDDDMDR